MKITNISLGLIFAFSLFGYSESNLFIKKWLLCGPFPNPPHAHQQSINGKPIIYDHTPPCIGLDTDFLKEHGGEIGIQPKPGMTHTKQDDSKVKWFEYTSPTDKIVFRKAISKKPNVVAYAYTLIEAPKAGPYILSIGSDEGVCVWVNGKRIHYNLIKRTMKVDDDLIPIYLNKGNNKILVKVEQGKGGWGFILRTLSANEPFISYDIDMDNLVIQSKLVLASDEEKLISIQSGNKKIGTAQLKKDTITQLYQCNIEIPFPSFGHEYGGLGVYLNGTKISDIQLPQLNSRRVETFSSSKIKADPGFIFSNKTFPKFSFDRSYWNRALIGGYKFTTTYYDKNYKVLDKPNQPGRYGAIVKIEAAGKTSYKYLTLFYHEKEVKWWEQKWEESTNKIPENFGLNSKILIKEQAAIANQLKWSFVTDMKKSPSIAELYAALYETNENDPNWVSRTNAFSSSLKWWTALKIKLGHLKHNYLISLPDGYDKDKNKQWPLLLFLHGSGERGNNLNQIKHHGPPLLISKGKKFPFIVVSPQCPKGSWWKTPEMGNLLDEVEAKYRVDKKRVYCTGLSMGGFGTWSLAMEYPNRFAAIIPICGGGDPKDVTRIKDIPTWVFHGDKDTAVILKRSTEMIDALKNIGSKPSFTVYPNVGHNSWTQTYNNDDIYRWLLKHSL